MRKLAVASFSVLALVGCSSSQPTTPDVSRYEITEGTDQLLIRGLDRTGRRAELLLALGHVEIPEDGLAGRGRKLTVRVGDKEVHHASVGMLPIQLPLVHEEPLSGFLAEGEVLAALARWDVTLEALTPTVEAGNEDAYYACTVGSNSACGATDCEQNTASIPTFQYVCCNTAKKLVGRSCNGVYPGSSSCGTNGPLGCAVCWSANYTSTCYVDYRQGFRYSLDGVCYCEDYVCPTIGGIEGICGEGAGGGCTCDYN